MLVLYSNMIITNNQNTIIIYINDNYEIHNVTNIIIIINNIINITFQVKKHLIDLILNIDVI